MKVDLSLPELKQYKGLNEKPTDFDDFWDENVKKLNEMPLNYEMKLASFQTKHAECYDLYFEGVGGALIYCQLLKPKNLSKEKKSPGIAMFHGYHGSSGDWFDKVSYVAEGFTVLAMDCRGQGGKSEDNLQVKGTTLRGHIIRGLEEEDPHKLYYRHVFLDTVQTARILASFAWVDETKLGAFGASQGGALAVACAALEPTIAKVLPVYPFLSDYRRAFSLDVKQSAYEELHDFFRRFDPFHEQEAKYFTTLGYIDIQHLASRIKADVLFVATLEDPICPPSTQFAAYNNIQSPKELLVYHDYGHEHLPQLSDQAYLFFAELLNEDAHL